jgi:CMP-N-acetylneuraminic acid synthetase
MTPVSRAEPMVGVAPGGGRLAGPPLPGYDANGAARTLPDLFCPTGAVWWARTDALRRAGTFHLAGRAGWELDWTHAIDIDTQEDWRLAEALMGRS